MKRTVFSLMLIAGILLSAFSFIPVRADSSGKVQICHATASETNPYVFIEVSVNSVASSADWYNGHGGHEDDIWSAFTARNGDLIPAYGDQSMLANECEPEEPTATPTVTSTPEEPTLTPTATSTPDEPTPTPTQPTEVTPTPTTPVSTPTLTPPVTQTPPPPVTGAPGSSFPLSRGLGFLLTAIGAFGLVFSKKEEVA